MEPMGLACLVWTKRWRKGLLVMSLDKAVSYLCVREVVVQGELESTQLLLLFLLLPSLLLLLPLL